MIYAVIDKEFDSEKLVENHLNYYAQGMNKTLFNSKVFWRWFCFGVWQSCIVTIFSIYTLEKNFDNDEGHTQEFWETGTMIFGLCVVIANLKIFSFSHTHNVLSGSMITGSLLTYLFSLLIVNTYENSFLYCTIYPLLRTPYFHLGNLLIILATCNLDFGYEMYKSKEMLKISLYFINFFRIPSKTKINRRC